MELLIVSGLSGAGKSVAMNALEDIGFFCIDNVPAGLLPSITAFSKAGDNQLERVALSMDVRGCRSRGLAAKTGQPGGVAVADELIEPCRPLDIAGGAVPRQGGADAVKVLPCVEYIPQSLHQFLRFVPHTAVQVDQQAVEVIVDLKVVAGRLVEQYPAPAAEHLNVPLIVEGEQPDDQLPQGLLASNPGHETVQGVSPPSSGRRVCAVSSRSRVRSSPRMAAAIPLIRLVRWAMVARTSWSVAA